MKSTKYERIYMLLRAMVPALSQPDGLQKTAIDGNHCLDVLKRDEQLRPSQLLISEQSEDGNIVTEFEVMLSHEVGFAVASFRRQGDRINIVQTGTVMNAVIMEEIGESLESWLSALRARHCHFSD